MFRKPSDRMIVKWPNFHLCGCSLSMLWWSNPALEKGKQKATNTMRLGCSIGNLLRNDLPALEHVYMLFPAIPDRDVHRKTVTCECQNNNSRGFHNVKVFTASNISRARWLPEDMLFEIWVVHRNFYCNGHKKDSANYCQLVQRCMLILESTKYFG